MSILEAKTTKIVLISFAPARIIVESMFVEVLSMFLSSICLILLYSETIEAISFPILETITFSGRFSVSSKSCKSPAATVTLSNPRSKSLSATLTPCARFFSPNSPCSLNSSSANSKASLISVLPSFKLAYLLKSPTAAVLPAMETISQITLLRKGLNNSFLL